MEFQASVPHSSVQSYPSLLPLADAVARMLETLNDRTAQLHGPTDGFNRTFPQALPSTIQRHVLENWPPYQAASLRPLNFLWSRDTRGKVLPAVVHIYSLALSQCNRSTHQIDDCRSLRSSGHRIVAICILESIGSTTIAIRMAYTNVAVSSCSKWLQLSNLLDGKDAAHQTMPCCAVEMATSWWLRHKSDWQALASSGWIVCSRLPPNSGWHLCTGL